MSRAGKPEVSVRAEPASMSPISIDPLSPMKILAGLKLCARKPAHAPPSTAHSSAVVIASGSPLAATV